MPEFESRAIYDRIDRHDQRLTSLETRGAVDDVRWENITVRLDKIEGTLTWLVRLIIGGLVMAVLAYALNGGLAI